MVNNNRMPIVLDGSSFIERPMVLSMADREEKMTAEEVSRVYQIPLHILNEYHSWGLCGAVQLAMDDWRYDERDIERLSMIMALNDMNFGKAEIEAYMRLLLKGESTRAERLLMLDSHRSQVLSEIHLREKQLERMDYLRAEMRKEAKGKQGVG